MTYNPPRNAPDRFDKEQREFANWVYHEILRETAGGEQNAPGDDKERAWRLAVLETAGDVTLPNEFKDFGFVTLDESVAHEIHAERVEKFGN